MHKLNTCYVKYFLVWRLYLDGVCGWTDEGQLQNERTMEDCGDGSQQLLQCSSGDTVKLDCWPLALYMVQKACVTFMVWLVCTVCETTALLSDLIVSCCVVLRDAFRKALVREAYMRFPPGTCEWVNTKRSLRIRYFAFQPKWHHGAEFGQDLKLGCVKYLTNSASQSLLS